MNEHRLSHRKSKKVKERRKSEVVRLKTCYLEDTTDVEIIFLSPLTQIFLGCRIGEAISVVNPWIYVKREKILDHLEFYGHESEFYQIQDEIMKCPLEEIMIGSCNFNSNIPVDFYLCKTKEAQESIERSIQIQNDLILQKISDSIYPISRSWHSLGNTSGRKRPTKSIIKCIVFR